MEPQARATYPPQTSSVYIKNLPPEADKLYLYERFAPHGPISSVKASSRGRSFAAYGWGHVSGSGGPNHVQTHHPLSTFWAQTSECHGTLPTGLPFASVSLSPACRAIKPIPQPWSH
jgi:RNA recognition motif. (a.k.a. RRM, RBD, or RNP domain)